MATSNPANLLGSTNISLTPSASGLTAAITGQIPVANGGTGAPTLTGVLTGNGTSAVTANAVTQYAPLIGGASNAVSSTSVGTAGQVLQSSGAGVNAAYSTATYPSTTTVSQILYSSATNTVGGLATANSSVLVTNSSGVPSLSSTLPPITILDSGSGVNTLILDANSNAGGTNLKMAGNGVTTPNKYLRSNNGNFDIVNSAYSLAILTLTDGGSLAVSGGITAATTLAASLGNITATNGNLAFGTAGNKIITASVGSGTSAGANSFGSVTLSSGTATVSTTAVTSSSLIVIWRQSIGSTGAAALGLLTVGTIINGTSFVVRAASATTATSNVTTDVSVVGWMIIN